MLLNDALSTIRKAQKIQLAVDGLCLGVTGTQLAALEGVVDQDDKDTPFTHGQLAHYLGVSPAVVTGITDRLERAKLVERRPNRMKDRRQFMVVPTEDGREVVRKAKHAFSQFSI